MIDAYIVRDPQGRVIGLSANSHRAALDDVFFSVHSDYSLTIPYHTLLVEFPKELRADANGYTLTREQVAL
jgi:hypothetical protein